MKYRLLFLLVLLFSCQEGKVPQENKKVKIGKFDADSAYAYIEKQVAFGKRYMNTQAHEDCKNWLVAELKSHGLEVVEQHFQTKSYKGEILRGTNVIARHMPEVKERMLLCAHYDTRHIAEKDSIRVNEPIDGADDGGSGVGVLLEIARQLKENPIPMGVDIILFDAEDYGQNGEGNDYSWGLGSQYWSTHLHEDPYEVKYGILLDMVGSKDATFPKEGYSRKTAGKEVNKIWTFAKAMGYEKYFVDRKAGFYTDDHRFIIENTSIPMIDVINLRANGHFGYYHHTHADNMDIIDKNTLQAVGQIILATVYKESNKDRF